MREEREVGQKEEGRLVVCAVGKSIQHEESREGQVAVDRDGRGGRRRRQKVGFMDGKCVCQECGYRGNFKKEHKG